MELNQKYKIFHNEISSKLTEEYSSDLAIYSVDYLSILLDGILLNT